MANLTRKDQITMQEPLTPSATRESCCPDIEVMRATADELLAQDEAVMPRHDDLEEMTVRLRGHLRSLLPVVEDLAQVLPDVHETRGPALAVITNAWIRLHASPGPGLASATKHAHSLGRELLALCEHHETLSAAHVGHVQTGRWG